MLSSLYVVSSLILTHITHIPPLTLTQFSVVKKLIKIGRVDAFVWISSFVAVICLGVDYGLAVGLVINLLSTIVRTSRPSGLFSFFVCYEFIYKYRVIQNLRPP